MQGNVVVVWQMINPTGASQQFKIIKLFVRGNFVGLGHSDRFRQKEAAAIARVADTLWDSRAPGEPRSVKSILQQQRNIEFLRAQFASQLRAAAPATMRSFRVIGD